jgi:hypothetical protein
MISAFGVDHEVIKGLPRALQDAPVEALHPVAAARKQAHLAGRKSAKLNTAWRAKKLSGQPGGWTNLRSQAAYAQRSGRFARNESRAFS